MQGRLGPSEDGRIQCAPKLHWREEFVKASKVGLYGIEWIDDLYTQDTNPLLRESGLEELQKCIDQHAICIPSVCLNRCIEEPLTQGSAEQRAARLEHVRHVIQNAKHIGAQHVVLPLLDAAAITSEEDMQSITAILRTLLPDLKSLPMQIHLETSLSPQEFDKLLQQVDDEHIRVTYDTGNSAGLGYNAEEEFAAYGHRIGSVHIKDKRRGSATVPLGTGDVDFAKVAQLLKSIGFDGLYTLEAARQEDGNEVETVKEYREFVIQHLLI